MTPAPAIARQRVLAVLCLGAAVQAQDAAPARVEVLAEALRAWHVDFHSGLLKPHKPVDLARPGLWRYVNTACRYGFFAGRKKQTATHFTGLQLLLQASEELGSPRVVAQLLPLAVLGDAADRPAPDELLVGDAVRSSILRTGAAPVWSFLAEVGRGGIEALEDQRCATLRLLAARADAAGRPAVEGALGDRSPAVRLAAAEALARFRAPASLAGLTAALGTERHPVVAQALLHAADRALQQVDAGAQPARAEPVVAAAFDALGRAGWRFDLAVVRLARRHPSKAMVPPLIDLLRGGGATDPLLKIVNRAASPVLAHEAWTTLRRITGALLPQDAGEWQEFWVRERDRITLVAARDDADRGGSTRAAGGAFFGIPVVGQEVVFVIDTSRSMRDEVEPVTAADPTSQRVVRMRRRPHRWTRLDAVKEQVLVAVAGMHDRCRFRIVAFSDDARCMHGRSQSARGTSLRRLMKSLDQLRPAGLTNTLAALELLFDGDVLSIGGEADDRVDEVFVMSDGEPSQGRIQETGELLAFVRRHNRYRQIRINTVFTGQGKGADFMRRLAAENHGVFVHYGR